MSLVWEHAPYSEGSLLVLLALADWANDQGIAWPSIAALAQKARLQRRRCQYVVRKLETDGFIEIEEGGGRSKQHRYALNLEKLKGVINAPFNGKPSEIKGAINAPFNRKGALDDIERVHFETQRVHSETQTVHSSAPDPLEEPLDQPSLDPSVSDPPFCSPAFCSALADFEQHRKEKRIKVTPTARRLMFKKFLSWGEERSVAALIHSTEKNYTGCFEEMNGNGKNQPRREAASERNARNLRENAAYIRGLSNDSGAADSEDPIGLLTSGL